ncbi:MAG: thioredoxin-disulfide reductase [candidate division Zixibacteria bacterium]|nr:thioredoxin-disulfide reductase [candidate division Zixibacteria bacterium]
MAEEKQFDIVIVGGGPGGLTAGLYGSRANLKTVMIEKYMPGGQIANTEEVEDYPGFEHISGAELAMKMTDHAKKFGLEILSDEIIEIRSDGDYKKVAVGASGTEYVGKAMVVCTGGSPVLLNVPGEKELTGKGVSYCAICDGAFFRDKIITVVGGGDAAVEEAMFLTKFGSKVILIHRRDELRAQKVIQERAFKNKKLEFIWDSVVEEVNGDSKVESLSLKNVKTGEVSTLETAACFVFIGFHPNTHILPKEIALNESGYVTTDYKMETSVPGIFVCGDIREQLVRQITNAVGDGTTAAMAAVYRIEEMED